MDILKIVLTGGPSTGKTTLLKYLEQGGEHCMQEISRAIILEAQKQGIEQLFLEQPEEFSKRLLEGRIHQYTEAEKAASTRVFLDRGIPDIIAYMEYANQKSPNEFLKAGERYRYHKIFILPPWKEIYTTDNERYENFEQAQKIHDHLVATYSQLGYKCILVPTGTVEDRRGFILKQLGQS